MKKATNDLAETPLLPVLLVNGPEDGILTVTLNRPDAFNALSVGLLTALEDALAAAAADPAVRCVVIAGNGKAFCAGHDLKEMRATPGRQAIDALFKQCSRVMLAMTRSPKPVIARVHGIATAAGCQLVAACDLAVAQDTARFAVSGVNLGLFCSTPMVALSRNLPRKQAMEMLLTGSTIDAQTALHYGLVNRVVPAADLDRAVGELASSIAAKSPAAIAFGKQLFYRQLEAGLEAAYALASETMVCNMMTEDAAAGIDAFIAKRPLPEWTGR
ncbi:MAG: enoyl-CoA hydratase [Rhodospirillales bacterium]|jgi:enoyl-CoA hydratase/carnithine racemase|nr:enoyl-CoA hydratase [Rhodospirillales bacterium]